MAKTIKVEWKAGYQSRIDAKVAHKEIQRLRKANGGGVTPAILVQEAKKKNSPLHPEIYIKDKEQAATEYYRIRAAQMLRSIVVRVEGVDTPVRVYTPVVRETETEDEDAPRNEWVSLEEALADPKRRKQVLQRARAELKVCRTKYAALRELAAVWHVIDQL